METNNLNKLKTYGSNKMFECYKNKNDIVKLLSEKGFLQNILLTWQEIKQNKEHGIIWNDSNLKRNSNTFYNLKNG